MALLDYQAKLPVVEYHVIERSMRSASCTAFHWPSVYLVTVMNLIVSCGQNNLELQLLIEERLP